MRERASNGRGCHASGPCWRDPPRHRGRGGGRGARGERRRRHRPGEPCHRGLGGWWQRILRRLLTLDGRPLRRLRVGLRKPGLRLRRHGPRHLRPRHGGQHHHSRQPRQRGGWGGRRRQFLQRVDLRRWSLCRVSIAGGQPRPRLQDSFEDVFVRDLQSNTTTLVSRASGVAGTVGDNSSYSSSISLDGNQVAFTTDAGNVEPDSSDFETDVVMRNLVANTTTLVSRAKRCERDRRGRRIL